MELAALPNDGISRNTSLPGDESPLARSNSSGAELLAGVVQLWEEGEPIQRSRSGEGRSPMSARLHRHLSNGANKTKTSSAERLRPAEGAPPRRSRSSPSWSAPPPSGSPQSGSGPGRPRSRGAVVTQLP